jgi:hypothetical protein
MLSTPTKLFRRAMIYGAFALVAASMVALAQDPAVDPPQSPPPSAPGWRRFSTTPQPTPPPQAPAPHPAPVAVHVPERITIPAGTFVTVRVDQYLSSDKNQAGDNFSATLARPLVVGGLVIARRGQTVGGQVIEAKKAGRVKGVSHLQIGLNTLTLADGHQLAVQTGLASIAGTTSNGRDAGAVLTTTALGAVIGGAADWGQGAAIGAGAGLVAGTIGVLVTRGRPTVIYPESQLTFRLANPVTFSTELAPQAFVDARTLDVQRASSQRAPQGPRPPGYQGGPYYPPPYYGPAYYEPYYPYFWGPTFGFGFYGRGFYGGGFRHR